MFLMNYVLDFFNLLSKSFNIYL